MRASGTCPVGRYAKVRSPYGCEGLIGNVSEWCQPGDPATAGEFPPHEPALPAVAAVRGSAFMRTNPKWMRGWHRRRLWLGRRNHWVGFRPALFVQCRPAA